MIRTLLGITLSTLVIGRSRQNNGIAGSSQGIVQCADIGLGPAIVVRRDDVHGARCQWQKTEEGELHDEDSGDIIVRRRRLVSSIYIVVIDRVKLGAMTESVDRDEDHWRQFGTPESVRKRSRRT